MTFSFRRFALLLLCVFLCSLSSSSFGQKGFSLFPSNPSNAIARKAKSYNLVLVESVVPGIYVDLRYKVTSAAKRPLYRTDMPCFLHKGTADKLRRVVAELRPHGYTLKIWDAWRPREAHLALWNAVQDERYVVPPSNGVSWHCYGVSVDLTLVRLDGTAVAMPSDFDEFSDRASSDYRGGDPEIAARLALLQTAMKNAGFRTIESEWWHFDDVEIRGRVIRSSAADLGIRLPAWLSEP